MTKTLNNPIFSEEEILMNMDDKDLTFEQKVKFYENKVDDVKKVMDFFENIKYSVRVQRYERDGKYPQVCIRLKIEGDRIKDSDDFFIWRSSLFNQFHWEDEKYSWGICRSNQLNKSFSNIFELHPRIKQEHRWDTQLSDLQRKWVELSKEKDNITDELEEVSKKINEVEIVLSDSKIRKLKEKLSRKKDDKERRIDHLNDTKKERTLI